ncbi:MAG: glycosyltransferase [Desulfatitalea sp.]|nr:glycosyltransferase [Desulfatitalea sp.]NNK01098.1 glycosyltransferase [Desulfatitalea sp.]
MRIALIGGRDFQQFPTQSYGGVETCVENLAWGLHKARKDFVCIVPKRTVVQDYPFEVIESNVAPLSGPADNVWPFAQSLPAIIKAVKPDVIWAQAFWAAETLKSLNIPIICTFHDFVPDTARKNAWFTFRENTWYRFISQFQFNQWVDAAADLLRDRSFWLHTGLADHEFDLGPAQERQDYYLWVAGLNWGWHTKGLALFIELAKRHPEKQFLAYGTGRREIEAQLTTLARTLPNFEFGGALERGQAHRTAFARARLFLMPTQMPEPFGRTVIESMSKGTPVLGSTNGAVPELIAPGLSGHTATALDDYSRLLDHQYDHEACYAYSRRFHIDIEIAFLTRTSEQILSSGHTRNTPSATKDKATLSVEQLLGQAMYLHQCGDLAAAEDLYQRLLGQAPSDADALNLLGVLYLQRRQPKQAEMLIRKAITVAPDQAEYHQNLANVLKFQDISSSQAHSHPCRPSPDQAHEAVTLPPEDHAMRCPTEQTTCLKRWDVIQAVLDRIQGHTYLEIGIDRGESFRRIRARRKVGVDPAPTQNMMDELLDQAAVTQFHYNTDDSGHTTHIRLEARTQDQQRLVHQNEAASILFTTSDRFFAQLAPDLFRLQRISVALLDGLHTHTQTYADVDNTLAFLDESGVILIHDCNPPTAAAAYPAESWATAAQMNIPCWTGSWCGDVWKSIVRLRSRRSDLHVCVLDCDYGIGIVRRGRPERMLEFTDDQIDRMTFKDLQGQRERLLNLKPQGYLDEVLIHL